MKLKKIFTMIAICCAVFSGLMLIASLFGIADLEGAYAKILLSAITFGVGATFAINATIIKCKGYKMVSYIAYGLIAVSSILFLLLIWVGGDIIFKAAIVVGVSSIFANIIMGNVVSLGKKYFAVQMIEYAMIVFIDVVIILLVFGVEWLFENDILPRLFYTACIVASVGMITLAVLSKKSGDSEKVVEEDGSSVTISKKEYKELVKKAKLYDEMMANKSRKQDQEDESANDFDNDENGAGDN